MYNATVLFAHVSEKKSLQNFLGAKFLGKAGSLVPRIARCSDNSRSLKGHNEKVLYTKGMKHLRIYRL